MSDDEAHGSKEDDRQNMWMSVLLSSVHSLASSTGSRRFELRSWCGSQTPLVLWNFSQATYTASRCVDLNSIWQGNKILFSSSDSEIGQLESLSVSPTIHSLAKRFLQDTNALLPSQMTTLVPGWRTGFLARRCSTRGCSNIG